VGGLREVGTCYVASTLTTHLLDAGADLSFVKDWLGHANIQNTTIYERLTNSIRDKQARRIFASHRIV